MCFFGMGRRMRKGPDAKFCTNGAFFLFVRARTSLKDLDKRCHVQKTLPEIPGIVVDLSNAEQRDAIHSVFCELSLN